MQAFTKKSSTTAHSAFVRDKSSEYLIGVQAKSNDKDEVGAQEKCAECQEEESVPKQIQLKGGGVEFPLILEAVTEEKELEKEVAIKGKEPANGKLFLGTRVIPCHPTG